MADDLRKLIADAKTLGFEYQGQKHRGGHIQFIHTETGQRVSASSTPGCWFAWTNTRTDMERIAGRRLPRPNKAAKHKFTRVQPMRLQHTPAEVAAGETVDALVARANQIRTEFRVVAERGGMRDVPRARALIRDYERIRESLLEHHRVLDPIY